MSESTSSHETDTGRSEILARLIQAGDIVGLRRLLGDLSTSDRLFALSHMERGARCELMGGLEPIAIAEFLEPAPTSQAAELIKDLPVEQAASVLSAMRSDRRADLLAGLRKSRAQAILKKLTPEVANEVRRLVQYPPETAGRIMGTEYLAFPQQMRVAELLDHLREDGEKYSDFTVQYGYIVDEEEHLVGILPLRDLLFTARSKTLSQVMIRNPFHVSDQDGLQELESFFDRHHFVGVPVVDGEGRLVGVVRRAFMEKAKRKANAALFLRFAGIIGGEELRTMPLWSRALRRLSFLSPNIALNILAASVIAYYESTLAAVIALAFFLPMISDMSGCSGNQAVAVSIRELSLGLIRPGDTLRIMGKESILGLINGLTLGCLLGLVAWLWIDSPLIGLVIGFAMAANTVVSAVVGGSLPLILKRFGVDPALVSSPVLTTVTDMCGFFLVLGSATMLLPFLVST